MAGGPLRVVAGLIDTPPLSMIAIPAHKPFGDLRGGRIGTSSLTEGTRHVAERMLAAHGLAYPADYDFALEGSHVERWKALPACTIDAALQMIPYDVMAVEAGFTELVLMPTGHDDVVKAAEAAADLLPRLRDVG